MLFSYPFLLVRGWPTITMPRKENESGQLAILAVNSKVIPGGVFPYREQKAIGNCDKISCDHQDLRKPVDMGPIYMYMHA